MVIADVDTIVENIGKNIGFMQPIYEAIVNSLEAHATDIEVEFFLHEQSAIDKKSEKIGAFTIIDNGEGFVKANRESFNKLWTKHKVNLGCKGCGRFTWLTVYKNINIISEIKNTKEKVYIPFSRDFTMDDVKVENLTQPLEQNTTKIEFKDLTKKIYNNVADKRMYVDKRENADIDKLYDKIYSNLLVKLFLLNRSGIKFNISLKLGNEKRNISNESMPSLSAKTFKIKPVIASVNDIEFTLYYYFENDNKNIKDVNLCAHERVVETLTENDMGYSAGLPGNDSFHVMVCSNYLDQNVSEDRTSLSGLKGLKNESIATPILLNTIISYVKNEFNKIIQEKYSELGIINKNIKEKAVEIAPYLAKYINTNTDFLISEYSVIKDAKKRFAEDKEKIHSQFVTLLKNADINVDAFNKSVDDVSQIALFELGEYINYRKSIIDALNSSILDAEKKEDFIHTIFMPKGTTSDKNDNYLLNNLWLLDDKFMTYSYAASDVVIEKIIKEIEEKDKEKFLSTKKPDLTIFYNKENNKDLVVVEFKGVNASLGEKEKSIAEVARNAMIIKKNISHIQTAWSYIITDIDDEFETSLIASDYKPLFTNDSETKVYYKYHENISTHVFAVDLRSITSDAYARNSTFLNILKRQ